MFTGYKLCASHSYCSTRKNEHKPDSRYFATNLLFSHSSLCTIICEMHCWALRLKLTKVERLGAQNSCLCLCERIKVTKYYERASLHTENAWYEKKHHVLYGRRIKTAILNKAPVSAPQGQNAWCCGLQFFCCEKFIDDLKKTLHNSQIFVKESIRDSTEHLVLVWNTKSPYHSIYIYDWSENGVY